MANLHLFYQGGQGFDAGLGGQLWYQPFDGTSWLGVQQIPNIGLSCAPAPVVFNGLIHVLYQGAGEDGQLWVSWYVGNGNWEGNVQVPNLGMSFSPSAVVYNNNLYVFHNGTKESGELWYVVNDGRNWSSDMPLLTNPDGFNAKISQSPSAGSTTTSFMSSSRVQLQPRRPLVMRETGVLISWSSMAQTGMDRF
jgi:hypothetical protein